MPQMTVIGSRSLERVGFILIGLLKKRAKPMKVMQPMLGMENPDYCASPSTLPSFLTNTHSWHLFAEWFQGSTQFKFFCNSQQIGKSGIDIVENTCFSTEFKYIYQMHSLKVGVFFFLCVPSTKYLNYY